LLVACVEPVQIGCKNIILFLRAMHVTHHRMPASCTGLAKHQSKWQLQSGMIAAVTCACLRAQFQLLLLMWLWALCCAAECGGHCAHPTAHQGEYSLPEATVTAHVNLMSRVRLLHRVYLAQA
jgi:hypothetical protein